MQTPQRSSLFTHMNSPYDNDFQPTTAGQLLGHAGMSTRSAYYSGRGVVTSDLNYNILVCLYRYIESGESQEVFPDRAAESFLNMVVALDLLAATPFIESLYVLERCGWKHKHIVNDPITVEKEDGEYTESSMMSGLFGMIEQMEKTDEKLQYERVQSDMWKVDLLTTLGKEVSHELRKLSRASCWG